MIQKVPFLCACLILAASAPAFSLPSPFALSEDEAPESGISAFSALLAAPGGKDGPRPLSVTEYQGASFGSLVRSKTLLYKDGKPDSETVFAPDGSVLHAVSIIYNEAGKVSEIRATDSSGTLKWAYRYEYDGQGRIVREASVAVQNGQEKAEGEVVFSYGGNGLLSKRETLSAEGAVTLSEAFSYDESGRLSEKNSYYGDGTLLKRTVREYASEESPPANVPAGALVRVRQYDSNGLYETALFEYGDGRVSSILRYGADSILKDSEALQYTDGKVSRRARFNAQGAPVSENLMLYDWAGNLVMERDSSGITIWEFSYPPQSIDGAS